MVEAPVFSHEGGIYTEAFTLTIDTKGAEVRYTLDGTLLGTADIVARESADAISYLELLRRLLCAFTLT